METNYNLNLDLSRIDYIFLNNDLQVNSEQDKQRDNILLDPFKLTYGEEQMLEKYLQIQLYKLPMERYDYFNEWKKAEGIIIRIHFDACITFYWGQKFKFTPTQIKTVGCPKIPIKFHKIKSLKNTKRKSSTIFNIFSNIDLADKSVALEENLAQDYYDSLASEEFSDY
jgi:hypothetical protein